MRDCGGLVSVFIFWSNFFLVGYLSRNNGRVRTPLVFNQGMKPDSKGFITSVSIKYGVTAKYDIIATALGRSVEQIACGDVLTGTGNSLVKSLRNKKKGEEA